MNPILLSFLCGSAFIGGACVTVILVTLANSAIARESRKELSDYWKTSIAHQKTQIEVITRIADALDRKTEK